MSRDISSPAKDFDQSKAELDAENNLDAEDEEYKRRFSGIESYAFSRNRIVQTNCALLTFSVINKSHDSISRAIAHKDAITFPLAKRQ